jgi:hypothetical protein
MGKFKVGDRVRIVEDGWGCHPKDKGKEAIIKEIGSFSFGFNYRIIPLGNWNYTPTDVGEQSLELIERAEPMSKYEELKARIEGLNNGWTKEADDILQEMNVQYSICIPNKLSCGLGDIQIYYPEANSLVAPFSMKRYCIANFTYSSQCEKNRAFKNALLWLLDHSDIKREKQNKMGGMVEK